MEKIICHVCGKEQGLHYINNDELVKHQMCFSCNFWREKLKAIEEEFPKHTMFVSNNTVYVIADEDPANRFRGFGGARVRVSFPDGTVVYSTNLWCNGTIDSIWRDRFSRYKASLGWL